MVTRELSQTLLMGLPTYEVHFSSLKRIIVLFTLLLNVTAYGTETLPITEFEFNELQHYGGDDASYFQDYPFEQYKEYKITGLGTFLIDDIDDYIKNQLRVGIWWERHIAELIKRNTKKGSVVLDLGAHIGIHTVTMSKAVGSKGKVIAFEPQMKIYGELVMNMIRNNCLNVKAYRSALGDSIGTIEMNIPSHQNEGGTCVGSGGDVAPIYTLDFFHFENVSLIKMDCENFEDKVLDGARETIALNRPVILIEIIGNKQHLPDNPESKKQGIIDLIQSMHYFIKKISEDDYICFPKNR